MPLAISGQKKGGSKGILVGVGLGLDLWAKEVRLLEGRSQHLR